jgi:hypothetical protein
MLHDVLLLLTIADVQAWTDGTGGVGSELLAHWSTLLAATRQAQTSET